MLDLLFYKLSLIYTGSPRRSAVLDLLHKKQSLISQLLSFAMFFATSGSLALLDSTLHKSARDDDFLFQCHCEKIFDFRGNPFKTPQNSSRLVKLKGNLLLVAIKKIINKTKFCL